MSMDIMNLVEEFYQIQAVEVFMAMNGTFVPFKHSHEKWMADFTQFKQEFYARLGRAIYDYTVLLCAGELRYAHSQADYGFEWYASHRDRSEIWYLCTRYSDREIIRAALIGFNPEKVHWASSFGGEKWYNIAKAGNMYHKVPTEVFIDHCVDLSHNSSCYFDKGAEIFNLRSQSTYLEYLTKKRYAEDPTELFTLPKGQRFMSLVMRARTLGLVNWVFNSKLLGHPYVRRNKLGWNDEDELFSRHYIDWGTDTINTKLVPSYELEENERNEREEY